MAGAFEHLGVNDVLEYEVLPAHRIHVEFVVGVHRDGNGPGRMARARITLDTSRSGSTRRNRVCRLVLRFGG